NGHAIAGGAILAMAADVRVMASGPFQLAVNEVQLGIPFPAAAFEIARRATPAPMRASVLLAGRRFSPDEAERAGLVHRLAPSSEVVACAVEEARLLAAAGPAASRAVKADLTAPVLARIDATAGARRERFLDHWFSAEARARVGVLYQELVARRRPDA